jgi:hypothetical protein
LQLQPVGAELAGMLRTDKVSRDMLNLQLNTPVLQLNTPVLQLNAPVLFD